MKLRHPIEYDRQLAQWLSSYVRVTGHEPPAHEIAAFEARQYKYPETRAQQFTSTE